MRFATRLALWALYASFVVGKGGNDDGDGDDDRGPGDDDDRGRGRGGGGDADETRSTQPAPTIPPPPPASSAPAGSTGPPAAASSTQPTIQPTPVLKGDRTCVNELVCIGVTVNGSTTRFDLSPFEANDVPGWMAIGFGEQMANSPMVIMWANPDGSLTLSQRQAGDCVQPSEVANPPQVATAVSKGNLWGPQPTFSFEIPTVTNDMLALIWAYCDMNPQSPDSATVLNQHLDSGAFVMDVSQDLASSTSPSSSSGSTLMPVKQLPMAAPQARSPLDELRIYASMIRTHAILFGIAFLILLPLGALVARLSRTWNPFWFVSHWIIQFYLAGPLILAAFIVALLAVKRHHTGHFNDPHKKIGLALFILYIVQCAFGTFVHFVKSSRRTSRPPQNYVHAILGLAILGLALYQVHLGYTREWPLLVATSVVPHSVSVAWTVWAVGIPLLYAVGLVLLPRQLRQERQGTKEHPLALEQTNKRQST